MSARFWLHIAPWLSLIAALTAFLFNSAAGLALMLVHIVVLYWHDRYVVALERALRRKT